MIDAALDANVEFEALYVDAGEVERDAIGAIVTRASRAGVRVFALERGVLEKVADATTPQPLLAAVRSPLTDLVDIGASGLILVMHDVRDPGNAGTIIRSADAAGATGVVLTGQSVDPLNPKTLRATAGSIFHLPVACSTLETTLAHFSSRGAQTFATVVRGGQSPRDVDLARASVVVVGNEADGLDAASVALCQGALSIPMAGRSESLNAGVAASLIAFEALWQRHDAIASSPRPSLEGS